MTCLGSLSHTVFDNAVYFTVVLLGAKFYGKIFAFIEVNGVGALFVSSSKLVLIRLKFQNRNISPLYFTLP